MSQIILKESKREENYKFQELNINQSKDNLRNLFLEAIEISRFNNLFNFGYKEGVK